MSARQSLLPVHSNNPQPTATIGGIVLLAAALAVVALFSAIPAHATLAVGSVTGQTAQNNCPAPGTHWLSYTTAGNTTYYMNCVAAEVTGCPEAQDIGFFYGYLNPAGIAPGITASNVQGVIVYFDGSAGTDPSAEQAEYDMMYYYFTQGYEIVQVAWNTAWEQVWIPWPYSSSPVGDIQNAACRPASFLYYVDTRNR